MLPILPQLSFPSARTPRRSDFGTPRTSDLVTPRKSDFVTPRRTDFHRKKGCTVFSGQRFVLGAGEEPHIVRLPNGQCQPAWKAYDGHVLRFTVRTQDDLPQSSISRDMTLLYYLEDSTLQLTSPATEGFGIFAQTGAMERPRGSFLRRHRVPHRDGGYFVPAHLEIGRAVEIYARKFVPIDCDWFTRTWYESNGTPQPVGKLPPVVEGSSWRYNKQDKTASSSSSSVVARRKNNVVCSGCDKQRQYMENTHKVCRFYACMDDEITSQFERRWFTIHYYLQDDSLEIRENAVKGGARESHVFYRRHQKGDNLGVFAANALRCDFTISDFAVGKEMKIANIDFFVYDADIWTRDYFKRALDVELEPKIDKTIPERVIKPRIAPSGLMNFPLNKDMECPIPTNEVLRFTAVGSEKCRRFLIAYYVPEGVLSIRDLAPELVRRSAPFLRTGRYCNELTGAFVALEDLALGKVVQILGREYTITGMDDRTEAYIARGGAVSEKESVHAVENNDRDHKKGRSLRRLFRRLNANKSIPLSRAGFEQFVRNCGYEISEDDITRVMDVFDNYGEGQMAYETLCAVLGEAKPMNEHDGTKNPRDAEYGNLVRLRQQCMDEDVAARRAMHGVGSVLHVRPSLEKKLMVEFKHLKRNANSSDAKVVDASQIQEAFKQCGFALSLRDFDRVCDYFNPENKPMEYTTFLRQLKATYHDFAVNR